MRELDRWTSGSGKVIAVGDIVRHRTSTVARYSVVRIVEKNGSVHVECYGGKPGRLLTRAFEPDDLIRCTTAATQHDPNEGYRETIRNISNAAKKHRRLR